MKSLIVCVLAGSCRCPAGPATAPECKVVKTPAGPRLLINGRATAPVMLFVNLADMTALEDLVARLSTLADHHSALAAVSLQPVNCWAGGVDVLGADIAVRPALTRKDAMRRMMT